MSDIHASLGISQFTRITTLLAVRLKLANCYNEAFKNNPMIQIPFVPAGYYHTFQSYMIRLRDGERIRNTVMQKLLDEGIATRPGVMASHLEPPYRKLYPKLSLPVTEIAAAQTIILPLFPQMTEKEQEYVIDQLKKILSQI